MDDDNSRLVKLVTRADRPLFLHRNYLPSVITSPHRVFSPPFTTVEMCSNGQPRPKTVALPTCCLLSFLILAYTCALPLQELHVLRYLLCDPPCLSPSLSLIDRNTALTVPCHGTPELDNGSGFAGGSTTLTLTGPLVLYSRATVVLLPLLDLMRVEECNS